jgi:hypothetical protein
MKLVHNQKGQFIIIAVMIIAIMMVSLSVTLYGATTYYQAERWEEYITLIDHVKLNTIRLAETSLANYTGSGGDLSILDANLRRWQDDLRVAYPGHGVVLTYTLAAGVATVAGQDVNFTQGMATGWNQPTSLSVASAAFTLSFASIGLEGYRFEATPLLSLQILAVNSSGIFVTVRGEDALPIKDLSKADFTVASATVTGVTSFYHPTETLVYKIATDHAVSSPVTVTVYDHRGIKVAARG